MSRALFTDRRGAALTEFAVTVPVFLTLILGVVQLGQLFWYRGALQHAVDMGARCASVNTVVCGNATQIQIYASTQSYGVTFPAGTFVSSTAVCGAQVAANYTFSFGAALLPALSIPLTARSCYAP